MKNGETYLTEYVDITKIKYDPNLFFNYDDTEEDKESVRQTRIEHGYSDDVIDKITKEINGNQAYEKDDAEDDTEDDTVNSEPKSEGTSELSVKNLVPKQKEVVETTVEAENIALSVEVKNKQNQDLYKELSLYQYQRDAKVYINNNSQSMSNMLTVQRDSMYDRDKYHSNENLKYYKSTNERTKYEDLEKKSKLLIDDINKNGICLCKIKNTFYYRDNPSHKMSNGSDKDASDFFSKTLRLIKIVNHREIINKDGIVTNNKLYHYILVLQIPSVEAEVFNPKQKEFFEENGMLYKNSFVYTDYLSKRFDDLKTDESSFDCFILDFLENITNENSFDIKNKPLTNAIFDWLSSFFYTMESSNVALVLNGNKEITNGIFWKKLIQPIFGYEPFSITINNEVLKQPISEIVKEKIFFNIVDFDPTPDNIGKINQLLHAILIDKYVLNSKQIRIPVYGQLLITATDTLSHMRKYYSQFEYIVAQDENIIIDNLANNIIDLELKFTDKELAIVSTYLALFNHDINYKHIIVSSINEKVTEESIEDKIDIDKAIDEFIQSIKNLDIEYFFKVEEVNEILYKELTDSLNIGVIVREDLCFYFNCVIGKTVFSDNKIFLKFLKEKDELFKQNIDKNPTLTSKDKDGKSKTKKRYLIKSLEQDTNFCKNQGS